MVSCARRRLLGEDGARKGTFHRGTRCVRHAFLCDQDPLTGQDYSYQRSWIMLREEQLVGLFTIDIEQAAWLDTVQGYDELFCDVVDSCASMGESAKWMEASQRRTQHFCQYTKQVHLSYNWRSGA